MKNFIISLLAIVFLTGISSCVKDKFDAPPVGGTDPNLTANITIAGLKAMYTGGNMQITDSLIVEAVVVGDDKSGNLYKTLAIEDSTGGIALTINGSNLYTNYPVGRRLFIKLKGLYLVTYKGLYEIVAAVNPDGSFTGIPPTIAVNYIFPGKWGINVAPKVVAINQLGDAYQSELIEIDNAEFAVADQNQPYANATTQTSLAHTLKDCSGNSVVVYTSGYADFATAKVPSGNGRFLAIYSVYNGTTQLIVRDTTDLTLTGPNCNAAHNITIAALRAQYQGAPIVLAAGTSITGTVISDGANGNINSKNMFIQDATGGMSIRFASAHAFGLGAKLTIDISGDSLINFKGGLEVTPVAVANAVQTGTGTVTPRVTTVAQINTNAAAWESTLVQITNATITGSGTYSGSQTVADGTAGAIMYTSSSATFAGTAYPTTPVTITCILSQYNGVQLQIRNTTDVQ